MPKPAWTKSSSRRFATPTLTFASITSPTNRPRRQANLPRNLPQCDGAPLPSHSFLSQDFLPRSLFLKQFAVLICARLNPDGAFQSSGTKLHPVRMPRVVFLAEVHPRGRTDGAARPCRRQTPEPNQAI